MPPPIGGAAAITKPPHGTLWVDVRDYGAKADNGLTDNSGPIQAAIDDLASKISANPSVYKGVVFIPSAPQTYVVYKSIWVDSQSIEIQGEGWGSVVQMYGGNRHSVFLFGIRRVEKILVNGVLTPLQINSSNRPDLFGKLDSSVATSAGSRWGLRTNNNSYVQFQACPISAGVTCASGNTYSDQWSETSKLTVETCIEPPDGQPFPTFAPLMGMGIAATSEPSPFLMTIWDDPTKVLVIFRTSEMEIGGAAPSRYFRFSLAGATAPYRIAVQFDLDNAVCTAFVNGVQVAITDTINMSAGGAVPFTPGVKFQTNDHAPFMVGINGVTGSAVGPTGVDLRVYGLRLSNTIRYQYNGVGQRQVRVDSPASAINDAYAYFGQDNNTICFLKGTDNPATSARVVTLQNGSVAVQQGVCSGIFLHSTALTPVSNVGIRDIFVAGAPSYGQVISVGAVLEMHIENVKAIDGYHAVGSFVMIANYYIYMDDCWLEGADAAYFGAFQQSYARDIYINSTGRVAIRQYGCGSKWENIYVAFATPITECIFKARGTCIGGAYSISNMEVDFEGTTLSKAAIYCEAHCLVPATTLTLKDIFLGTIGSTASAVMLKDTTPDVDNSLIHKCWVSVDNLQLFENSYVGAIDVDGPLWHGEVNSLALSGTRLNHRQKWGTNTNVIVRETRYVAPPRTLAWYPGAHVLDVRSPIDGQFTQWRCVGAGRYGTSTPPKWCGLNPLMVTQNGLAAYVLNHAYITVAIR